MRNDKSGVGAPGIDSVATISAAAKDVLSIQDHEGQPESGFQLVSPLQQNRCGGTDNDAFHLLTHQKFTNDQASLNGFAKTYVVGDKEVDSWQQQRLSQRLQLVGHNLDAGPIWRLEEPRISGRD